MVGSAYDTTLWWHFLLAEGTLFSLQPNVDQWQTFESQFQFAITGDFNQFLCIFSTQSLQWEDGGLIKWISNPVITVRQHGKYSLNVAERPLICAIMFVLVFWSNFNWFSIRKLWRLLKYLVQWFPKCGARPPGGLKRSSRGAQDVWNYFIH
jgi:hypothetical protein